MSGYLLGLDVGSSSVKASLLAIDDGRRVDAATCPKTEMKINAPRSGWAEQEPEMWWRYVGEAIEELRLRHKKEVEAIKAVGISYQMHGLVPVDKSGEVLRPSIIWCDSRAVSHGNAAFDALGPEKVLSTLLNSPGNFTAAKLAWVKENEPELYDRIWKIMLPGDYIAYRLTGEIRTTYSGLSEGIFWDFTKNGVSKELLDYFGFDPALLPEAHESFTTLGTVESRIAREIGLPAGVPVSYRAGDQPNNAFSLRVLEPGELAATAGTSGVVYGIVDKAVYETKSRVNTFVHVNHRSGGSQDNRFGVLLALNGTGILNKWTKQVAADPVEGEPIDYGKINEIAGSAPIGSKGLVFLPFGNGAERMLENQDVNASLHNLNFNIHDRPELFRAAQEGIVFALNFGIEIMRDMGLSIQTVRAGDANMFLSPIFREAFATTTGTTVELYSTDGSEGAARGAGVGAGIYKDFDEAYRGLELKERVEPDSAKRDAYREAYETWQKVLEERVLG